MVEESYDNGEEQEGEDVSGLVDGEGAGRLRDAFDPALYYILFLVRFNLRQMEAFALPGRRQSQVFLERGALNRVYVEEAAAFFFGKHGVEMMVRCAGLEHKVSLRELRRRVRPLYRQALVNLRETDQRHAKVWLDKRLSRPALQVKKGTGKTHAGAK